MESIEFTGLMLEDLIDIGLEEMCAISMNLFITKNNII